MPMSMSGTPHITSPAANGRASLGLRDAGTVLVDRDHPDLAGVAAADLPLAVATCGSAAVVATPAAP